MRIIKFLIALLAKILLLAAVDRDHSAAAVVGRLQNGLGGRV